jgi:hypothetical protein
VGLYRFICQWVGKRIVGSPRSTGMIHDDISRHMFRETWFPRNENEVSMSICHYTIRVLYYNAVNRLRFGLILCVYEIYFFLHVGN